MAVIVCHSLLPYTVRLQDFSLIRVFTGIGEPSY